MSPTGPGHGELRPITRCRIDLPEGSLRVRGVAGDTASLVVRGTSGTDQGPTDPIADGRVVVRHQDGELSIRSGVRRGRAVLGGLVAAGRGSAPTIELSLPRDAALAMTTVDAEIRIRGCRGGQSVRTVTGEARIEEAAGRVEVSTVSGSAIVAGGSLDVEASTTSGWLQVHAHRIESVRIRSVSGAVEVAGEFAPGAAHRIESLSGDVTLLTNQGATLMARTISGRVTAGEGARRDARHGVAMLVVGDGAAEIQARSVSGSIRMGSDPRSAATMGGDAPEARDPLLDALEALARGEITVDEADRRLEGLHG